MLVAPRVTYPGVYIQEVQSDVRTIIGVDTATTAFVGRTQRGPVNTPVVINSYADFERIFGGLWLPSALGYAVSDFYLNGGAKAVIVRLFSGGSASAPSGVPSASTPQSVAAAARDKAQEFETGSAPRRIAANEVATDAETAAGQPNATVESVIAAAKSRSDEIQASDQSNPAKQAALDVLEAASAVTIPASADEPLLILKARLEIDTKTQTTKAITDAGKVLAETVTKAAKENDASKATVVKDTESAALRYNGTGPIQEAVAVMLQNVIDAADLDAIKAIDFDALATAQIADKVTNPNRNTLVQLEAISEGTWGNNLRTRIIDIDSKVSGALAKQYNVAETDLFTLIVHDTQTKTTEEFVNLTVVAGPRQLDKVLQNGSSLVRCYGTLPSHRPGAHLAPDPAMGGIWDDRNSDAHSKVSDDTKVNVENDTALTDSIILGDQDKKEGLYALADANIFNLLCIPPYAGDDSPPTADVPGNVLAAAAAYCQERRAILLVDSPKDWDKKAASEGVPLAGIGSHPNAAIYFPRIKKPNPLRDKRLEVFTPSGTIAGIMARTDSVRGVWKAPAGLDATLNGVFELTIPLTNEENGELNPLGINCLRKMPAAGNVVWGARTLVGDDRLSSQWKYIPVRRTALFIEETLYRNIKWAVFEPNDEPLWAQLRLNIGVFMNGLFRQGAFQGQSPKDAYFVKCDATTTTQADIDKGIVNVIVGFAPLKPAEFVVIYIQQIAGQLN